MNVPRIHIVLIVAVVTGALLGNADKAAAAEGAASNYFPGGYGSLLVGLAPEPGAVFANLNLFYSAEASRAVLQGRANVGMDVDAAYLLLQGLYTWDAPSLGGRFAIGGYVPLGYASLDASLSAGLGSAAISDDETALGDIGLIPASFYWSAGNWNFNPRLSG